MANRRQGRLNRTADADRSSINEIVEFGHDSGHEDDADPDAANALGSGSTAGQGVSGGHKALRHEGGSPPTVEVVRLSVNLLPDTAMTLKELCKRNSLNLTEGIKRAIRLWKIVDDANLEGGRVLIESPDAQGERTYREVVFV